MSKDHSRFFNNDFHSTRRHFLSTSSMGIGGAALAWLIQQADLLAKPVQPELHSPELSTKPKTHHQVPRAKAMISLWMQGGPSHIDMFDPKPELNRLDGQTFPGKIKYDNAAQASSRILGSPWKFKKYGQCGMDVSELLPYFSQIVDDVCLIRSMRTGVNNHGQSIRAMNAGRVQEGQPVLGSWLTYGLGSESQALPAYVALIDPGQLPVLGVENWSHGFLPALYQGTVVRPREPRILNLTPPDRLNGEPQRRYLEYLARLNHRHLTQRPGELDLQARTASYTLAARMQTSAKEALDLSSESEESRRLYGLDDPATKDFGARCMIARRLIERGVRFVQVFTENQRWDHHGSIRTGLPDSCKKVDKPSAALVTDLKRRGLLETTLVHWGGEMGRLPVIQNDVGAGKVGRDHNTYGFSMWLAGGGIRGGMTYGATDEFGHHAVENIVNHFDYHATLLHLFGLDREQLAYKQNNQMRSLLEGEARVVREILA